MKLKFIPTDQLKYYEGYEVNDPKAYYHGQIIDVPAHRARQLLKAYPQNFFEVETIDQEAILNEIVKIFNPQNGTLKITKLNVSKNGKFNVEYENNT